MQRATQRLMMLGLTFSSSLGGLQSRRNLCSMSSRGNENYFEYGSCMRPHPDKEYKGGEDAMYVNSQLVSVMDGVGGWAEQGVDPAKYSKQLAYLIANLFNKQPSVYLEEPKQLIIESTRLNKEVGSTTCVIVTIHPTAPTIYSSYIGDSGYIIFRRQPDGSVKQGFMTDEHTHGFNFPFQVGSQGDSPHEALTLEHQVHQDDIIVVGSDGLFDNVDVEQVEKIVNQYVATDQLLPDHLNHLARHLADAAKYKSLDTQYMSPFAKRAIQYGYYFKGGKSDDITVVVAQVKLNNNNL